MIHIKQHLWNFRILILFIYFIVRGFWPREVPGVASSPSGEVLKL
jgi:hypothetical protein